MMSETVPVDYARIASELNLRPEQVQNTVSLLDDGNTVPFITRYRKERTGNLEEDMIREIDQKVGFQRQLAERAQTILRLIESQGKLTDELRQAITSAQSLKTLEDLYLPFRPKRTSRATQARERGLEPLANAIWNQDSAVTDLNAAAAEYIDPEKSLNTVDDVLQGVADILSETISEMADIRARCRRIARKTGQLKVTATKSGKESGEEYRNYFDYSESISSVPPHRVLAINRGEKAGKLRVKMEWDSARANTEVLIFLRLNDHRFGEFLQRCAADAISRSIFPSLEREIRREMTDAAESQAISVFARNLRNLLLQPPLHGERVLAIDPGFRTGCKIAVLDECGNCQATDVIFVSGSEEKRAANMQKLHDLIEQHQCQLVAIGNGTGCRETEEMISELIADKLPTLRYLIVNEAGASVYSTSTVAREEFPDFDATVRGTISIGRRLLDPLSELVKIEPQHIGVGMYQHDIGSKKLKESLDDVVESCVNYVGVDLNTASSSLLRYVSGLNQLIARRIVEWRDSHGRFQNRRQLRDVPGIGEATFTQAAGFLKIAGGDEPLDNTWIHPESYDSVQKLLNRFEMSPQQLMEQRISQTDSQKLFPEFSLPELASELNIGEPTLQDILESLTRPGRDPRSDQPGPVFKQGILKLDDLAQGMELTGTVLNVVDFGAFVDIGLKDSGLVHISQIANRFIKSPHEVVSVGDVVTVWVLEVDQQRRRVSLTMIPPESPVNQSISDKSDKNVAKDTKPSGVLRVDSATGSQELQPTEESEETTSPPVKTGTGNSASSED
ncbi:MAG: Tex family protein [Planctomycetaceae bacterium]